MRIVSAEFERAVTRPEQAPPPRPSVVFAGRSNVGKSSLLNRLVGRKGLARVSNTPGRTREIHFYTINGRWHFIDLPGYGYARLPEAIRRRWGPMVEGFLNRVEGLRLMVIILDIRRDPEIEEFQLIDFIGRRGLPFVFAVNKCDKVGRHELTKRLDAIQDLLGLNDRECLLPVSARTGTGIDDLRALIGKVLTA